MIGQNQRTIDIGEHDRRHVQRVVDVALGLRLCRCARQMRRDELTGDEQRVADRAERVAAADGVDENYKWC